MALLAASLAVACQSAPSWPTGRLVDRPEAGPPERLSVGSTSKRALRGLTEEHVFRLDGAPPAPMLLYSAGVAAQKGTVRFEVALRGGDEEPVVLQRLDAEAGAWVNGRVDLGAYELGGRELVLRRVADTLDLFGQSGWGDPVLLPAGAADPAPSVILISLDTLRADALGAYGASAGRTPALDTFAAEGVQFVQAYSPSVWTLPSHEALFTGRYPRGFGSLDDTGAVVPPPDDVPSSRLPLASVLREAGYLTAAFTGGGWVDAAIGLPRRSSFADGFDSYYGYRRPPLEPGECRPERLDGETVFGGARDWLRARKNAPSFVFIHTYEPHDRCPFASPRTTWRGGRFRWKDKERPDGKREVVALYDELVARTDGLVARLLDELETLGRAERTLVVITSDHGELFGEHGDDGHGANGTPFEELTRVPLLLRFPGRLPAGKRIAGPASVTSVAATILALLGLETALPEPPLPGLGLAAPGGAGPETGGVVYVDAQRSLAVRDGRWKLITARDQPGAALLYDVETDPGESADQSEREAEVRTRLQALATQYWDASTPASGTTDAAAASGSAVEPEAPVLQDQLRQLGYLE